MLDILFYQPLVLRIGLLTLGLRALLILSNERIDLIRLLSLSLSLIVLLIGLLACLSFDKASLGFQFLYRLDVLQQYNLALTVGVDGLSFVFILLTLFTFPLCFLSAWEVKTNTKQFYAHLLARELLLILTFATLDLFYFYLFFESLLIPRFILIGVWGARGRKIKAAYYFFLYTLLGSLVRLFGVLYLYFVTGSTNYFVILNTTFSESQQCVIWACFFLAFAVKRPLFPFHIWLPEAHVEAPTVGSRLLASLRLKLGGYGFLRFSLSMLYEGSAYYAPRVSTLALLGVLYGSLSTIRQIDLKRIIAYSSVAHRNLVMLGLFSYTQVGIEGAVYLRLGHGVVSAALFFCVGVLYDRYHSRLLRYYGGLVSVRPLFAVGLFIFTLANRSFPGTSNFLGEILLFLGIFRNNSFVLIFATAGIVLSAVYSTWRYNRVTFGTLKTQYILRFTDLTRREFVILATFTLARILLGLSANFVRDFLSIAVKNLLVHTLPRINQENVSELSSDNSDKKHWFVYRIQTRTFGNWMSVIGVTVTLLQIYPWVRKTIFGPSRLTASFSMPRSPLKFKNLLAPYREKADGEFKYFARKKILEKFSDYESHSRKLQAKLDRLSEITRLNPNPETAKATEDARATLDQFLLRQEQFYKKQTLVDQSRIDAYRTTRFKEEEILLAKAIDEANKKPRPPSGGSSGGSSSSSSSSANLSTSTKSVTILRSRHFERFILFLTLVALVKYRTLLNCRV